LARCSAPVREMPALSTNMAMTVRVAELLNPAMPSSGVTCFDSINTTMTNAAVMSAGSHSITNKKSAPAVMAKVTTMLGPIDGQLTPYTA
jgi:hypothetical protein